MRAYCYATGLIHFGRSVPDGALEIARGQARPLRAFIEVRSRHGYRTRKVKGRLQKIPGTDTLLVPGIPEAPNQHAALDALRGFCAWLRKGAPHNITVHR